MGDPLFWKAFLSQVQRPYVTRVEPINILPRNLRPYDRCRAVRYGDCRSDRIENIASERNTRLASLVGQRLAQQAFRALFEDLDLLIVDGQFRLSSTDSG